jgi:Tol biopolymer transport system component
VSVRLWSLLLLVSPLLIACTGEEEVEPPSPSATAVVAQPTSTAFPTRTPAASPTLFPPRPPTATPEATETVPTEASITPEATPVAPEHLLGVFVVPADGSDEPLKVADDGFVAGWSPDGALIAFTLLHPDQTGCGVVPAGCFSMIFLVRADGTEEPTKLADGNAPVWAPGTNRLLFYTLTRGELTTWQGDTYPAIVGRDVYVADLTSGRTITLASNRSTEPVSSGGMSSWSPDGSHVLLGWGNLYMVKADGSEPPLKIANGSTFEVDWSPDGKRIVYSWGGEIYSVAADGSEPPRKLAIGHQPYWSPDGSRIAFIAKTLPTSEIWLVDPDTGEASKLVDGRLPYFSPKSVWSPDGSLILYRAEQSIYVVDPQGSAAPTKLGDGDSATWSPDGERVAITRTIEPSQGIPGASQLFVVNADGSGLTLLLDNLTPWCVTYAWSPDSQRIAFSSIYCPLS